MRSGPSIPRILRPTLLVETSVTAVIQVNGKVKSTVKVGHEEEEASVKAKVWQDENIKRLAEGRTIVKEIYVKGRIYTIVMK